MAEDLNSGPQRTNPASGQSGTRTPKSNTLTTQPCCLLNCPSTTPSCSDITKKRLTLLGKTEDNTMLMYRSGNFIQFITQFNVVSWIWDHPYHKMIYDKKFSEHMLMSKHRWDFVRHSQIWSSNVRWPTVICSPVILSYKTFFLFN